VELYLLFPIYLHSLEFDWISTRKEFAFASHVDLGLCVVVSVFVRNAVF
jgi:hypothetical protein